MARRKNPHTGYETLKAELLKYGDEGKQELRDIIETHRPEMIFQLPPGPDRAAKEADLISHMRETIRDIVKARAIRKSTRVTKVPVRKKLGKRWVSKTFERFKYDLIEEPNKKWSVKLTRKGRQLIHVEGAPKIEDQPAFRELHNSEYAADLAVRRAINTVLIWYGERGITLREKPRKTKYTGRTVTRRTAAEAQEREREKELERERRRKAATRERRERRKLAAKTRPREARLREPEARIYIPKNPLKNPARPQKTAAQQAKESFTEYRRLKSRIETSQHKTGVIRDFKALMDAYDALTNSRANYVIAGDLDMAGMVDDRRKDLKTLIINMLHKCYSAKEKSNPTEGQHKKLGQKHLERSQKSWEKYRQSDNPKDLFDAYKYLELAHENFKQANNKDGTVQAKEGLRVVRAEMKGRMG